MPILSTAKLWLMSPRLRPGVHRRSFARKLGFGAAFAGLSLLSYKMYNRLHRLHAERAAFLRDRVTPFGVSISDSLLQDCVLCANWWESEDPSDQAHALYYLCKTLMSIVDHEYDTGVLAIVATQVLSMAAAPRALALNNDKYWDSIKSGVHLALSVTIPASWGNGNITPHERLWAAWFVSGPAKPVFEQKLLADATCDRAGATRRGKDRLPALMAFTDGENLSVESRVDLAQSCVGLASSIINDTTTRTPYSTPFPQQDTIPLLHDQARRLLSYPDNGTDEVSVHSVLALIELNLSILQLRVPTATSLAEAMNHANRAIELSKNSSLHSVALAHKEGLIVLRARILGHIEDAEARAAQNKERASKNSPDQ